MGFVMAVDRSLWIAAVRNLTVRTLFAVAVLGAGVAGVPAGAGAEAAKSGGTEYWTIASEDHFPPYNFTNKGQRTGIDTQIVNAILKELGVEAQHKAVSWPEVVKLLDTGKVDVAFQFVGNEERFKKYFMIGPFRVGTTVIMMKKGKTVPFNTVKDLVGLRIGIVKGFSYSPDFDAADFLTKIPAGGSLTNFRRLFLDIVDAIVGDRKTLEYFAEQDGLRDKVDVLEKPLILAPRYIAMPRAQADKAARFRDAFERLKAVGAIDRIITDWQE
ncbi:MAG: transporter substrate-binding domain-containing protein [Rhodospirillaceae bacterium]